MVRFEYRLLRGEELPKPIERYIVRAQDAPSQRKITNCLHLMSVPRLLYEMSSINYKAPISVCIALGQGPTQVGAQSRIGLGSEIARGIFLRRGAVMVRRPVTKECGC